MDSQKCSSCNKDISSGLLFCPHCGNRQTQRPVQDIGKDPYQVLQISPDAELEVIEAAYKTLAKKYHPDVDSSPNAQERMREINWAYEFIKNNEKKREPKQDQKQNETNVPPQPKPQTKPKASQSPKPKVRIVKCPTCGNEYPNNLSACPHCRKREVEAEKERERRRNKYIGAVAIGVISIFFICPLLFGAFSDSSATASRPTITSLPTKLKPTPINTSTKIPTKVPTEQSCLKWSQVGSQHVGKLVCVYGEVVRITPNLMDHGHYLYTIRFVDLNDNFLVKAFRSYSSELKVGQCWSFIGVVYEEAAAYFYMNWGSKYFEAERCP